MDQNANRGTKRKRYEPAEEPISTRIVGKLHHQIKEVHKASKRAKIQETQKVVKRLKDIRKKDANDKAIEGFEAELTSLKEIDHDAVGNSALKTKILKDHTLKENEDVKSAMTKEFSDHFLVPATPGTTLAKIQSRLLSSKILATQISASLDSLKILLNPALKQRDSNAAATQEDSVEQSPSRPSKILKSAASSTQITASSKKAQKSSATKEDEDSDIDQDDEGGESDSSRDFGAEGWESGSVGGDDAGADDGWESGSVGSAAGNSDDSDDDQSESEDDLESDNEELRVKPTKSKPAKPAPKPAKGSSGKMESTFLPSLAMGFVRGSDDSDFSDTEAKDGDLPKKNRRGQRARRLIWEKKFGRNANHKKKEAEIAATLPAPGKNSGHASKTRSGSNSIPVASAPAQGPSAPNRAARRGNVTAQGQQPTDGGWGRRTAGVPAPASAPPPAPVRAPVPAYTRPARGAPINVDDKPLHPSWEAKRKLREKESAGIVPSQGKKIVF